MRVALFSKAFSPSVGGVETSSAMLAHIWRGAGHDVRVVTATPGAESTDGVPTLRDWSPRRIREAIRAADVVVTNGYSRVVLAMAAAAGKRPVILHQGYQLICSDGLGFRRRVFHDFARSRDLRLALGDGLRVGAKAVGTLLFDAGVRRLESLARHVVPSRHVGHRLGLRRYTVLYQPPNPEVVAAVQQQPAPSPAERRRAFEEGDILFFGRLVFEKGTDDLIRSFALARAIGLLPASSPRRLVIHGEGPELPFLRSLARELGLGDSVRFGGFLKGADLVRRARAASLVVFPSRWEEPGGTLAVELFMMGAAVLASRRGAPGEIFEGHGRLFENRDVDALTAGLCDHFRDGPRYPSPTGEEPWGLPHVQRVARSLVDPDAHEP